MSSLPSSTGTVVSETVTIDHGAELPKDDLTAALTALTDEAAGATEAQKAAACLRIQELVHAQASHKHEAIGRGALLTLAKASNSSTSLLTRFFALKAIRSLVFKNDAGREKALPALAACVKALSDATNILSAAAAGESGAGNVILALAVVEEASTTLVAIVNKHEANEAAAKRSEECSSAVTKANDVLQKIKSSLQPASWPPSAEVKEQAAKALDEVLAAGASSSPVTSSHHQPVLASTPDSAMQKLMMLGMMLQ